MSDTNSDSDATPIPEQIDDQYATDIATLQNYLRVKERGANQVTDVELYDPAGANVNFLDYIKTAAVLSMPPIEAYEITSDDQLVQLLQTRATIAYSVLKIGGNQTKVLVCRSVAATTSSSGDSSSGGSSSTASLPSSASTASSSTSSLAAPGDPGQFKPTGSGTLIRGQFTITAQQISALCASGHNRFNIFAQAIAEDSARYGLNPLFMLADFFYQNTNQNYLNPWGISVASYPYGQQNPYHADGPRVFGQGDWRLAFDRQSALVANTQQGPYRKVKTIEDWAAQDAPPGAGNDPGGTNAEEPGSVGDLYNRLVKAFNA